MNNTGNNYLNLGFGVSYNDLYDLKKLEELRYKFLEYYKSSEPENFKLFGGYLNSGDDSIEAKDRSEILISSARVLSDFLGKLFNIENELNSIRENTERENFLFTFKKDFIQKNLLRKFKDINIISDELKTLNEFTGKIKSICFPELDFNTDEEYNTAHFISEIAQLERDYRWFYKGDKFAPENFEIPETSKQKAEEILLALKQHNIIEDKPDDENLTLILEQLEKWLWGKYQNDTQAKKWMIFFQPIKTDYDNLVEHDTRTEDGIKVFVNHEDHFRLRDGFKLNEIERTERQFMNQVDYCMFCHDRGKDSCSTGLHDRFGELQKNPLGNKLKGCPLDEKISESHILRKHGYPLASLSMIMIDNPMCPGTGHRICNDCMKGCIYQKQEPVNIPLVESTILREVLNLPYGFELYSLLTRWNPLNKKNPVEKEYNGKKILVTGMGPAGYTLAHYLLNEGFGVVGIDGLKIERLFNEYTLRIKDGEMILPKPVKYFQSEIYRELDQRVLQGFGGVTEYGITVRWDKNFITVLYLTLMRRKNFAILDGVTLGTTMSIDDALNEGFDHVSLCTGAAKPTIIRIKNNLIGGIRKSSDFLMQLQLTGAQKDDNLTSLQMTLPAIVIGGGLTAIDCATELIAYYPVMVEKMLARFKALDKTQQDVFLNSLDQHSNEKFFTYLEHAKILRIEKENALTEGRKPDIIRLVRKFGGVRLIYRKRLNDAPAYRENHEEVIEALEQGVDFAELLAPVEAVPDGSGNVCAMKFEKQLYEVDAEAGKQKFTGTGEIISVQAKTVVIAAGTSPNTIYNDEHPDTFEIDEKTWCFKTFDVNVNNDTTSLAHAEDGEGFFTSYIKDNKTISFFGDCHPNYFGSVVKAMASVKKGYEQIVNSLNSAQSDEISFYEFLYPLNDKYSSKVVEVKELPGEYISLSVKSKNLANKWQCGEFFKIQNYETESISLNGVTDYLEPIFLSPVNCNAESGVLEFIVNTMGASTQLLRYLRPGQKIFMTGPSGTKLFIPENETVLIAAEGYGNFNVIPYLKLLKEKSNTIIYFASFKNEDGVFDVGMIKNLCSEFCLCNGSYIEDEIKNRFTDKTDTKIDRVHVNGCSNLMRKMNELIHSKCKLSFENVKAFGTLNTTMQCMMNGICANCLQEITDESTGKTKMVYGCLDSVQKLGEINYDIYNSRLGNNEMFEKLNDMYLKQVESSVK